MENASKALLIAGAILLAILLISLGIMVFNQGQDVIKNSGMSKAELSTFNSQFTKYEGDIRGTDLKALIQDVNGSNSSDVANNNKRQIFFVDSEIKNIASAPTCSKISTNTEFNGFTANPTTAQTYKTSGISSTSKYGISIVAYDSSGFVQQIKVEKK